MIQILKHRSPVNVGLLLIFGILIKLPVFLHPHPLVATQNDEELFHQLVQWINGSNSAPTIAATIAFVLLFAQAFMVNYAINQYRMVTRPNDFPAMAYLLITSLLPEWNYLSSPLITSTLIIWCFLLLFRLYNKQNTRGEVYNIGLITGISSFIYFPSATFIICFLLGILILKAVRLREVVLLLLGALTPYYFFAAWLFLSDSFTLQNFLPHLEVAVPDVKSTIYLALAMILLAIPFLVGGFFVQSILHKMLIQVRKNWTIILLYLLLAFFVPFVNSSYSSFSNWILLAAPFSAFHAAAYFYPRRQWFPLTIFLLTTAFVIYQQYFTTVWQAG